MSFRLITPDWLVRSIAILCALVLGGCSTFQLPRIDPSGERIFLPHGTAAATPGVAAPVLQPGEIASGQPGVRLNPARVIAPVGSEVVMVASVCGDDGYTTKGQRVEWMLAPGGVGEFVTAGERHSLDLVGRAHDLPRKVDNTYAINTTLHHRHCIDRGTPTPADDIVVERGQSWATVTSPIEGTSQVTAFAPSVEGWDRRLGRATIYWVDAQWSLPPPAVNPVGTRHAFTTTVTRQSDGSPLTGWIVRYEIAGGPPAGFGPDTAPAAEVVVGPTGQAIAEICQSAPAAGTNQVNVQIIRPAGLPGGGERLVVGGGPTHKTWTTSELVVRVSGPTQAVVGSVATYRIEVSNPGGIAAQEVVVSDEPPAGLVFMNSNPAANSSPSGQEWRLGSLGANETKAIEANFRVAQEGNLEYCASVTAAGGLSTRGCATTAVAAAPVVVQPGAPGTGMPGAGVPAPGVIIPGQPGAPGQIEVCVNGPPSAVLGSQARFEIEVINHSTATLTGLLIQDRFDPGLEHAVSASPIERDLPELPPLSTRTIGVTFRVTRVGQLCQEVTVSGPTGVLGTTRFCVQVVGAAGETTPAVPTVTGSPLMRPLDGAAKPLTQPLPEGEGYGVPLVDAPSGLQPAIPDARGTPPATGANLKVEKTGPSTRRVGEIAEFVVDVTNTGTVAARQVRITDQYAGGLLPTEASAGHQAQQGALVWTIDEIAPGKSVRRRISCRCTLAAERVCNTVTVTAKDGVNEKAEACLQVQAAAADAQGQSAGSGAGKLTLSIAEDADPLRVGAETTYQIVLKNAGTGATEQVQLTAAIPEELTVLRVTDYEQGQLLPRSVRFGTVRYMRPGDTLTFELRVRADKPGTAVLRLEAKSTGQPKPVTAEENTQILPAG